MTNEDLELLEFYETRIRKGFPSGEIKTELLKKGFTEEQADNFMVGLLKLSSQKSDDRNINFRMVISAVLILVGIFQLSTTKSKLGWWLIISGVIKIGYDLYSSWKKEA